jgi:hypothetical protein
MIRLGVFCEKLGAAAPMTCEDKPAVKNKAKSEIFFIVLGGG